MSYTRKSRQSWTPVEDNAITTLVSKGWETKQELKDELRSQLPGTTAEAALYHAEKHLNLQLDVKYTAINQVLTTEEKEYAVSLIKQGYDTDSIIDGVELKFNTRMGKKYCYQLVSITTRGKQDPKARQKMAEKMATDQNITVEAAYRLMEGKVVVHGQKDRTTCTRMHLLPRSQASKFSKLNRLADNFNLSYGELTTLIPISELNTLSISAITKRLMDSIGVAFDMRARINAINGVGSASKTTVAEA